MALKIVEKEVIIKKPSTIVKKLKAWLLGEWQTINHENIRTGNFVIQNCFCVSAKLQEKIGILGYIDNSFIQVIKVF